MASRERRVVALGAEARLAAENCARFFQCKTVVVDGVESPLKPEAGDLVVCTTRHLTASLLHTLYVSEQLTPAPGMLFAETPEHLIQVCNKVIERTRQTKKRSGRLFLYTGAPFNQVRKGHDLFLGGEVQSEQLLEALTSDPKILTICGHGYDIDVALSLRHHACPQSSYRPATSEYLPLCAMNGRCTRYSNAPRIEDAFSDGRLVSIDKISAEIAVLASCRILQVRDAATDPAYGLAVSLLDRSEINVLVTSWRQIQNTDDGSLVNDFLNDVCSGMTIGEAVATFNGSSVALQTGARLCVVGDPWHRLPAASDLPQLPRSKVATPSSNLRRETSAEEFLRLAVQAAILDCPLYSPAKGDAVIAHLDAKMGNGMHTALRRQEMEEAFLDFLGPAPRLEEFFRRTGGAGVRGATSEEARCPACGSPASSYELHFPGYALGKRLIIKCAACFDSMDLPRDWLTSLDLSSLEQKILTLKAPPAGAFASVNILSRQANLSRAYPWPRSEDGKLAHTFRIPDDLPAGPLYCQVLLARGIEFGTLGFPFRQLSSGFLSATDLTLRIPSEGT